MVIKTMTRNFVKSCGSRPGYVGTEELQSVCSGQIKYTEYIVGITDKIARVLTQIKRLNSVLEATENRQSFLSKPMLHLTKITGEPKQEARGQQWRGAKEGVDARDVAGERRQDSRMGCMQTREGTK